MKLRKVAIIGLLALIGGCGTESSAPPAYPASAAAATVIIIDTDLAGAQLSVQDGDQVIAMMKGQQYAKVPVRPGSHTFSAGTGAEQGSGNIAVDVQPGQVVYLQVGGLGSFPFTPNRPGFATSTGRVEGSYGRGGVSLIPEDQAATLMRHSTEQRPLPAS